MCFAPCLAASFLFFFSFSWLAFFSLYLNVCARPNRSPFVYVFPSYSSMVARTGNSATTASTNSTQSVNNYKSSTVKMTLPQTLRTSFHVQTTMRADRNWFVVIRFLSSASDWIMDEARRTEVDRILHRWIFSRRCSFEWFRNEWSVSPVFPTMKNTLLSLSFVRTGKALLLLTEDSFKQRSPRAGDILHKALQQHKTTLKSFHCQSKNTPCKERSKEITPCNLVSLAFPYQLWNNFVFPPSSSSSARRFNIPTPPALPMSSFHSANIAGALPHAAATSCMHPAFNYVFNHSEAMAKSSLLNHRANYSTSSQQQQPMQNHDTKGSTKSTQSRDMKSGRCEHDSIDRLHLECLLNFV